MAGLVFKQFFRGTDNVNSMAVTGLTLGSFIITSHLAGPIVGGTPPTSYSDGFNTWVPLVTDNSGNPMNYFYCANNVITGAATFTAVGASGGTQRQWFLEFTGQDNVNPIAAVRGTGLPPVAGPLPEAWTNLTSILSDWDNGVGSASLFDGGAGVVVAPGGGGAVLVMYNTTLQGPGTYTGTWTQTSKGGNGMVVLVKAATSTALGDSPGSYAQACTAGPGGADYAGPCYK